MNYSHLEQYDLYNKQWWIKMTILSLLVNCSLCDAMYYFIMEIISIRSREVKKTIFSQSDTLWKANPSQTQIKLISFKYKEESALDKLIHSFKKHL